MSAFSRREKNPSPSGEGRLIDDADEPLEEQGLGEIVRVNNLYDPAGEDDLQEVKLIQNPNSVRSGVVWFSYDASKVKLWKDIGRKQSITSGSATSPTWDLTTDTLPGVFYIEGLAPTTGAAPAEVVCHYQVGATHTTDTILLTVTDKVGHFAYFRGVRDYLVENKVRVFMDDVLMTGGFPTGADFKLVAFRKEKATMSVIDAKANNWTSIDAVWSANPQAHVIINGTFFTAPAGFLGGFGDKTEGTVVDNGAELTNISQPVPSTKAPAYKGHFSQKLDGTYVWARNVEANTAGLKAGVSGLAAFIPKNATETYSDIISAINVPHPSQYESAVAHVGVADVNSEGLVFLLFTADAEADDFPSQIDRAPMFEGLVSSGASMCYGLDGSGSIGVVHEDLTKRIVRVVKGNKHTWLPWKVNNYIIFEITAIP